MRKINLIRYNVQSMYVNGPVSWEYQADDEGQWLPADTTLDYIKSLEDRIAELEAKTGITGFDGRKDFQK